MFSWRNKKKNVDTCFVEKKITLSRAKYFVLSGMETYLMLCFSIKYTSLRRLYLYLLNFFFFLCVFTK